MSKHTHNLVLSVLLFKENDAWVAQCIQYDIAAQGETIDEAMEHWTRSVVGHIVLDVKHARTPLQGVPAPPIEYKERFDRGHTVVAQRGANVPQLVDPHVMESVPAPWMISAMAHEMRVV